jgi:hypothetical protein
MVNYILPRGGGAVNPSLPSDSPHTPQAEEETQAKEKKQAKVQARVRKGMGYYKHLLSQSRATVEKMQIGSEYRKAILGMIARTIDGKVIHRDEFLGRLSSLRSRDRSAGAEGESLRSLLLAQAAALPTEESLRPLQGRDGRADRRAMLTLLSGGGS